MTAAIRVLLRRPVGVTATSVLVLGLAMVALWRLPVSLLPAVTYPSLVIWTPWPDMAPDEVERAVTEPIEKLVAGVPGLRSMTSRSQLGGSLLSLDFGWNQDLDLAALEVRQRLDRMETTLPDSVRRPLLLRVDPSNRPIFVVALRPQVATTRPSEFRESWRRLMDLKEVAEEIVARRFEQLEGVARVRVTGGYEREIRVEVDPERLAAFGLDLPGVETAIREANVSVVGGSIRRGPFRYAVEVSGELRGPDEVAAVVVSSPDRPPVRLGEVASVRTEVARRRGLVRLDGREVLLLLLERRPDSNTLRTVEEAKKVLADLRAELTGVELDVVVDEGAFIETAVQSVVRSLVWGGLLAVGVLLVFLRRLRWLAAVAVAVPLSLSLALLLFQLLGVSLNILSLAGLALGVGLLVDNSVVVVENIARLREAGVDSQTAAARGAAGVGGAITASTLTTLAVFVPLTWVEGLAGRLFRDQSLGVVCSVGASLLVALTVVPLLASREREATPRGKGSIGLHRAPGLGLYEQYLSRCLDRPRWVLIGVALLLLVSGAVCLWLPREVIPATEEGRVEVRFTLPPDAALPLLDARSRELEAQLKHHPSVHRILADVGERDDARLEVDPRPAYQGELTVVLEAGHESESLLRDLASLPRPPGLELEAQRVRSRLDSLVRRRADLVLDLMSGSRALMEKTADRVVAELRELPELVNVTRTDPNPVSSYRLTLDRDATVRWGARPEVLDSYLDAAARGREVTRVHQIRRDTPVILRTTVSGSIESLLAKQVPARGGILPLSSFLDATPVSLPGLLLRRGQTPVIQVLADLAPDTDLQTGKEALEKVLDTTLPSTVRPYVGGAAEVFRENLQGAALSLVLSVVLIYLILATKFESLGLPLVVLAIVPLAVGGVAVALALTGQSWNLMSLTGCIVLVGIAVNDAILKVDFIQQQTASGADPNLAVCEAGRQRYRPILMTTATTVLGLVPLALGGMGATDSAALEASLAVALVGGLLCSTLLSLLVVPVLWRLVPSG